MAEFVKVMKIATRACKKCDCQDCPADYVDGCAFDYLRGKCIGDFALIEQELLKWDADHPPKTMEDVLFERFPNVEKREGIIARICPDMLEPAWGNVCGIKERERKRVPSDICKACWKRDVEE